MILVGGIKAVVDLKGEIVGTEVVDEVEVVDVDVIKSVEDEKVDVTDDKGMVDEGSMSASAV